jgi:hypothetical protein
MILRCRLCHTAIAAFDPADATPPLSGAMFAPLEPGFPLPFDPAAPWKMARCPFCRHHPQGYDPAGQDRLETNDGEYVLGFDKRSTGKTRQMNRGK